MDTTGKPSKIISLWMEPEPEPLEQLEELARQMERSRSAEVRLAIREHLSNKEIAAALHISIHTVEAHLTRIYRKLGIRSRAALARRLNSSQLLSRPAESSSSARPAGSESRDRAGSTRAAAR